ATPCARCACLTCAARSLSAHGRAAHHGAPLAGGGDPHRDRRGGQPHLRPDWCSRGADLPAHRHGGGIGLPGPHSLRRLQLTFRAGTAALVVILFDGGLNTPWTSVRGSFSPPSRSWRASLKRSGSS